MHVTKWALLGALVATGLGSRSAKAQADTTPPAITPEPVAVPAPGKPLVVTCDITDQSGIFAPLVYWRPFGWSQFAQAELKNVGGALFKATIPLPPGTSGVEYYLEAYDTQGNGPAWVGSPTAPLKVSLASSAPVAPPPPVPPPPVTFAPSRPSAPPRAPPTTPLLRPVRPPASAAASARARPSPVLPIALVSVGGVGVITGVVFGMMASSDDSTFKTTYDPVQRPKLESSIHAEALGADISVGVGVVAAAVGTTLLFLERPAAPEDSDEQHLVLVPTFNGVLAEGSF